MPKVKSSCSNRLRGFVKEFGEHVLTTDGSILYCKLCEVKVGSERRFTVEQHMNTAKHIRLSKQKEKNDKQQLISNTKISSFNLDLCRALTSANIPLNKVNNAIFRDFLEKYTGKEIPDESTMRKNYLSECYQETMNTIRSYVTDKKIWVSIDETTDCEGRYIANVVVGTLEKNESGKIFLLTSEQLERANFSTISKLFDKSMNLLWPNDVLHDNVLLFLTDAAPYMVKAANSLKALYSKMVHVTCLAHAHHRVAEKIRGSFKKVDELISNAKKVFLKAPSRIQIFKDEAPAVPLPPTPVITRWGTWLDAAVYYADHVTDIRKVFNKLDPEDAVAIQKCHTLLNDPSLEANLVYIQSNYGFLSVNITRLESSGQLLSEAISIVNNTTDNINKAGGQIGNEICSKFKTILEKNSGFKTVCQISKVLNGELEIIEGIEEELTAEDFVFFKFSPITSVEVERSFSR